ncbi:MAG: disulfide bond formation protein DsbA [Herminiimonas sp.]|jgi:protein-disulfide isomerase|nr:disulfide bond formation protein DsbA [Herminiimonas sp.]
MSDLKIPVSASDHIQGNPTAMVTLVEYGDYQCPYCGEAYPVVKVLQKHFGKDLRFVFRNFPLAQIHQEALPAAETAEFAGAHGPFWEAHEALYENQAMLGPRLYATIVKALGLSDTELLQALRDGTYRPKIQADFDGGVLSGVNGTPSFFVNGHRHHAGYDLGSLAQSIEAHRRSAGMHHGARRSML